MFEAQVLDLLRKYLGDYVHGLSNEALRISVWKGDVVLKDLKLKAEALNSLKLPVIVNAGFVGTITLKVPWKSLGKEPVVVLIDRVFILAHPTNDEQLKEEDREKAFDAKLQKIEEAELATLEAATKGSKITNSPTGNSWFSSLVATIIGNLKITISNVHIRYEDSVSNPGHPFCSGITLAKLAAVTMDENGNETFDSSGALDKLRKSLNLQRLAVYHDSDSNPWRLPKKWEDLSPAEWTEIFAVGIENLDGDGAISPWAMNRKYLVSPINGVLKYLRLGKLERHNPEIPFEKVSIVLSDVSLTVLEVQYYDSIKFLESLSRYKVRLEVSHLRPMISVSRNPAMWWRYAVHASLQQKKMCCKFSWERIKHLCDLRRCYVQLYASSLQQLVKADSTELRQIERDLDPKVIVLWRLLAHAKIEFGKSKEVSKRNTLKKSWWSFGWRTSDTATSDNVVQSPFSEEKLTTEEWKAINKMLSYNVEEHVTTIPEKDSHLMILFLIDISIGQASACIVSIDQSEIVCGRFEQLNITTKLYHKRIKCDVLLRFCGLSAPEGTLAQTVSSEKKVNALAASFVQYPVGENVDWRLSAAIAPCHVTVYMKSYERFLGFIKRSKAVSPTVALETATVLQMKIGKVTRRAQEQFQMVLEKQSRFSLNIDFDAPKLRVPLSDCLDSSSTEHFLLDLGHFTLKTREDEQKHSLYSCFYIFGKDIAAFFKAGHPDNGNFSGTQMFDEYASPLSTSNNGNSFYSLIDRCRMSVIVDQIKVPHPNYPSTKISIQVPNICIQFSPARYHRMFILLDTFYSSMEDIVLDVGSEIHAGLTPWYPLDLASSARILVWKGFGNSSPEWKPRFIILSGIYLYVLESEISQSYKICVSMSGRHVFEVSPASIGGSCFSIAVSFRGIDVRKALESSSTLIIEFQDDSEKTLWLNGLIQATYIASASPTMELLEKTSIGPLKSNEPTDNQSTADLVINGSLLETKLFLYGKLDRRLESDDEALILVVLANGAKVNLIRSGSDLIVKMKLHSLKITDELQYCISGSPKYIVFSLLKKNVSSSSSHVSDFHEEESSKFFLEENDIYTDALQDFTNIPDQNIDMATNTKLDLGDSENCTRFVTSDGMDRCMNKDIFTMGEVFYETEGNDFSDFVHVIFMIRSPDSLLYDGVDTTMSIRMSKLDFFFHRPTLVALIDVGLDLNFVNSEPKNGSEIYSSIPDLSHDGSDEVIESESTVIKGLLGYGKRRVLFHLGMNVDSVSIFLNKEDGSHLAMFVQERFLLDLKVHPSSISIEGSLGNMKLYDMSLGPDHHWGWICDIRDQIAESLIKFNFKSYFSEDDDYDGYDYQLSGQLSAVRLVFLYRFVQEIMVYFMEIATPHTEEVIKLVDKVGGFERLIQKSEVDGATSLKLDLSLDAPVIIVPYNTTSKNFMQLDLGQLQIHNNFSWHGGDSKNPSSIHLDILQAEIHGINLAIGIDGILGKPMIREGQGFKILICRSLRDVFGIVPTVSIEVKIGLLHCVMSDNEYSIIVDCAYTNIAEEPKIPPSFRINDLPSKDSIRTIVDKVSVNSQALISGTVALVSVDIQHALLDLCNGLEVGSPLAQISLEGLWVSYRYTSLSESDLYVTIPKFSILDIRPDVKAEMCLMLGSSSDVPKLNSNCFCSNEICSMSSCQHDHPRIIRTTSHADIPNLTMLIVDCRWRSSSKSIVIRMQQPHVLVVLDFILAVAEFFVPAMRAITGRDETSDPENDPIFINNHIIPVQSIYIQTEKVVLLSSNRKLIIDAPGSDEIIYDGCGGTIRLIDCQNNDNSSSGFGSLIIIIGRGKKLRFMNVKIMNGTLLRKYTYLSSDSSYSICENDGVEICLKDSFSNYDDNKLGVPQESIKDKNVQNSDSDSVTTVKSFSFEAQIVSPEFTFYDSSKGSVDDSLSIEKLLRIKMEMSFMFASKENDTWIRSLVKDLTVEAGSGLVVIDPLDISGAYTSVKDKTNISVIASDVCSHLSLSVASLLFQLQNQVSATLQFGNANPVASCTNFKRVWIFKKGSMSGYKLTFWRPEAPSNYVILSDCVTSRPIPPTHVVMAISNTYGRVKKPFGFKLIGRFSNFDGVEEKECQSNTNECSLWIPLAPPGYSAVGCVVHLGIHPPPTHTVYCIRSDLVTSTMFSDCIFTVPVNPRMPTGFSIWRIDNAAGSFYAHNSLDRPSEINSLDLHHIILSVYNADHSGSNKSTPDTVTEYCQSNKVENENSTNTSGWDVLKSYSKPYGCYMSTPHFERIWSDKGTDHNRPLSIWRPLPRPGFSVLGDCIVEGLERPSLGILFKFDFSEISARPVLFSKVSHIRKGIVEAYFWYPIAPPGYASLGCVVTKTDEEPNKDSFCCPRLDMVSQANVAETPIFEFSSKDSKWSIWKVENQTYTFLARADHKRPSSSLAFSLSDHIKPKPLQNISAEMKLGSFSLSILDGAYGMITPLFDVTIININLVTHGQLEAINAVLICSIAASTFNRELEAWEPLVEPFDGIFKVETYVENRDSPSRVGMCIRVAATSTVNLNISSANLETLTESILSWRTQIDLEKKAVKKIQESGEYLKSNIDQKISALEEDDHRKIILENRLGFDLYLKKVYQSSETLELLHHENNATISIPPSRFSDRLNVVAGSKESCYYFSVRIFEAKELPILDDGNGHDFFCAIRIIVDSNTSDYHKKFPQSARTRSVKPYISKIKGFDKGTAKWNEVFLFEIPEKGSVTLELEVTNLSSKAGKGEILGALSIPIRNGSNTVMQSDLVKMFMEFSDNQQASLYPLKKSGQSGGENRDCGILLMSTACCDQNTIFNLRQRVDNSSINNEDIGFWVSSSPLGPWESFGSLLALSVVPKLLDGKHFACEVFMKNGKKHVVLRSLATVINNTDIKLEISVCQTQKKNRNVFAILDPGFSAFLPWSSMSIDSDLCLQVRPYGQSSEPKYIWSQTFASKTADDDIIVNPRLLSKQSTLKHKFFSMTDSALMLRHLEKKDVLLFCKSNVSGKQDFWLNTRTDASTLHTDINNPIYDWRITLTSPLRLENKLPYQAEYFIWEKTVEGTSVERQNGIISPDGNALIYSVDLCRPIYLSLFVQGGWVLDQDIVLLMDISVSDLASSFRMVQKQSKRKLHVSIERDLGGNIAAPKTVRLFVPYCINNDMRIPLNYRIVEIGSIYNGEPESPSMMKSVKSAKLMLRHIPSFVDKRNSSFKRSILEIIEGPSPSSVMLSPLDYISHPLFNEPGVSPRVGIAVAAYCSENFSPGISLYELENKERFDVKAFATDDSYYKVSVSLSMASDRTKVVHLQPHTLFINRLGHGLYLRQSSTEHSEYFYPSEPLRLFQWWSSAKNELLELRMDGYKWSTSFSVNTDGVMNVSLRNDITNKQIFVRVEVRSGVKNACYEVIFRLATSTTPYRIENRSLFLPLYFRQASGSDDSWQYLLPNSSVSFCWEDLGRQRILEVLVDKNNPSKSEKINIDDVMDYQPNQLPNVPMKAICVTVVKEGNMNICIISDLMPENESFPTMRRSFSSAFPLSNSSNSTSDSELQVIFELGDFGLSIIDRMPEEILYFSLQNLLLSYSTGLETGISRFKLRVRGLQVDNQLPFTSMPVLFKPQKNGTPRDHSDYILKFSLIVQRNSSLDLCIYPHIDIQGPDDSAFLVNIHEPVIWRLHEMIQQAKFGRIYVSPNPSVSVDPIIQIGNLNISEVRFKVSMSMSPTQRPGGVLGFWLSLMTALGNMENMTVKVNKRYCTNLCMRQSDLISTAISNVQRDLLSQPLQLISGVDILGNASSALGHISKGVAALSMDKKFILSREKQESKGVEDIGDFIREGGGAFAKGLFRGVTGILTKPLEGAKSSGMEGFVQGVGKGIIGVAAQPVSGVLDLLSKTTEGANAVRMKITSAITSGEQLLRKRLPRVIGGQNLIKPFDEYGATGQAILQLAESGTFFGQVDLFKIRGKFAISDAYEDHFLIPNGNILLVTHRRVLLLQQPSNIMGQKKFNPARDPCSVLWDVLWEDLVTMELTRRTKDHQRSPPSRLILYLNRLTEAKEPMHIIKCTKESQQAIEIYNSIDRAMNTYGPRRSKEVPKVTKPCSPFRNFTQVLPRQHYCGKASKEIADLVSTNSTFGAILPQGQPRHP